MVEINNIGKETQADLRNEQNIVSYLEKLRDEEDKLIIMAVCDTLSPNPDVSNLTSNVCDAIRSLSLKQLGRGSNREFWAGYIAIKYKGKVIYEQLTPRENSLFTRLDLNGISIEVASSPYKALNVASIKIDDIEYAINRRGLNIVIFDPEFRNLCDSVAFDTWHRHIPSSRVDRQAGFIEYNEILVSHELIGIYSLSTYLKKLSELNNHLIIFAVKDTICASRLETSNVIKGEILYNLKSLGLKALGAGADKEFWAGYVAICANNEVIYEKLGTCGETIHLQSKIKNLDLDIKSSPYRTENIASIRIDKIEYAVNQRGINIVVYDLAKEQVIDSVAFDTWWPNAPNQRHLMLYDNEKNGKRELLLCAPGNERKEILKKLYNDDRFYNKITKLYKKLYNAPTRENVEFEYNIILNCDTNLFNPMLVLIFSFHKNLLRSINLFVLQSDFPNFRKMELYAYCAQLNIKVTIIDINIEQFRNFLPGRLPKQGSFYILAHELLPKTCDRALYIDIDTLVLKDVTKFYNIDFEDAWLAACQEYDDFTVAEYMHIKDHNKGTQYRPFFCSDCIFNAGVQVINLEKFRNAKIKLEDFSKLSRQEDIKVGLVIQPIINRFVGLDVKLFPKLYYNCWSAHEGDFRRFFKDRTGYNEAYSYYEIDENEVNSIIHFTAFPSIKPWKALKSIDKNGQLELDSKLNSYQKLHTLQWWEFAQHIPAKNYAELIAGAVTKSADADNQALIREVILKAVNYQIKEKVALPGNERIHKDWKFVQYPVSADNQAHFEYNISGERINVAFHLEGSLKKMDRVIKAIMEKDNDLQLWQTDYGIGCYYANNDIRNINKSVEQMQNLIHLALPILASHSLVNL